MRFYKRAAACCLALTFLFLFGCAGTDKPAEGTSTPPATEIVLTNVVQKLQSELQFDDELSEVSLDIAKKKYGLNDLEPEQAVVYMGTASTPEEISLWEAASAADAATVKAKLQERIDKQKDNFADYRPEEVPKLDKAVLFTSGNYVFLCISASDNARSVMESFINS